MHTKLAPDKITYDDFKTQRTCYDLEKKKLPEKLEGLQELRYTDVPEVVTQRKKDGEAFLEKTEVQSLVEWKLYVSSSPGLSMHTALTSMATQQIWHLPSQSRQARRLQSGG